MNEEVELIHEEIADENVEMDKAAAAIEVLPPVHTTFETAYQIESYPYGRRLRCKRAVWVEHHPCHGQRFVSRTTNPKKHGEFWNTPHADTYNLAVVLYRDLNDDGHIKEAHLHNVWNIERAREFLAQYGAGLDEETRERVKQELRAVIQEQARPSFCITTTIDVGGVTDRQKVQIAPKLSQEEAARLLAEFAPAPRPALALRPAPEPAPLGPIFGG